MAITTNTRIDGNLAVGIGATVATDATVRGNVIVGHNLRVDGWLDAPNVQGPCKGLFTDDECLRDSYPEPQNGWYALVGYGLPADVYVAMDGVWGPTGERSGSVSMAVNHLESLEDRLALDISRESSERRTADSELDNRLADVESGLAEEQQMRMNTFTSLHADLMNERVARAEADSAEALARENADHELEDSVHDLSLRLDAEDRARTAADTAINTALSQLRVHVDGELQRTVDELHDIMPTLASRTEVSTAVGDEAAARSGADAALSARIDAIEHPVEVADTDDGDLVIADEDGNAMLTVADGHVRTAQFDSLTLGIEVVDTDDADLVIADEHGTPVLSVMDGHVRTAQFDSAGLISEPAVCGAVHRRLRILSIGNSYSNDALSYVPFMARAIDPSLTVEVGILHIGGCTLQTHWENASNNRGAYTYYHSDGADAWTSQTSMSILSVLQSQHWDMVLLQQQSSASRDYATYQPYLENLVRYICTNAGYNLSIGWLMTPVYPDGYSALGSDTSATMYAGMISAVRSLLSSTAVDVVIPCGTAIQNARTDTTLSALGQFGGLTYEGLHLQDGLPCQIEAYVVLQSLFDMLGMPTSVLGDTTRVTAEWTSSRAIPGMNGTPVGSTDENCYKAQKCAILAVNRPFEVSQI